MTGTEAGSGVLSIDEAVNEILGAEHDEHEQPQAETVEKNAQETREEGKEIQEATSPEASDADGAETQTEGEATAEGETSEAEEAQPEPLEAPQFWDAASKEHFGKLDPVIQQIILDKENERTAYVTRQAQEAADKRKAADGEMQKLAQLTQGLDQFIPQAKKVFANRWEGADQPNFWTNVAAEYGAEGALKLRGIYDQEAAALQKLETTQAQAQQVQFQRFVETETTKLHELVPDLADPKLGTSRKQALGTFLVGLNIPVAAIKHMTAVEAAIAYDAMQWRNGRATAAKLATKKAPVPTQKTQPVKAAGAVKPQSTQQARIKTLMSKKALTIDEAVELGELRGE